MRKICLSVSEGGGGSRKRGRRYDAHWIKCVYGGVQLFLATIKRGTLATFLWPPRLPTSLYSRLLLLTLWMWQVHPDILWRTWYWTGMLSSWSEKTCRIQRAVQNGVCEVISQHPERWACVKGFQDEIICLSFKYFNQENPFSHGKYYELSSLYMHVHRYFMSINKASLST